MYIQKVGCKHNPSITLIQTDRRPPGQPLTPSHAVDERRCESLSPPGDSAVCFDWKPHRDPVWEHSIRMGLGEWTLSEITPSGPPTHQSDPWRHQWRRFRRPAPPLGTVGS